MDLTLFDKVFGGGLLAGKKTYIAALVIAGTGLASYLSGEFGLSELVVRLGEAFAVAGFRSAIGRGARS